jgi:hypothetical protein
LSRGKRNPRSRSKASSSGCIDSIDRIVGRIRSERAHVACHHGVVAGWRLYRRMIFLPTPQIRDSTVQDDETNMRRNPFVACSPYDCGGFAESAKFYGTTSMLYGTRLYPTYPYRPGKKS